MENFNNNIYVAAPFGLAKFVRELHLELIKNGWFPTSGWCESENSEIENETNRHLKMSDSAI